MSGITDAVKFFEELLAQARPRDAIVARAADLIQATVGARLPGGHRIVRAPGAAYAPLERTGEAATLTAPGGVTVWHEAAAGPVPTGFLERLAAALRIAGNWDLATPTTDSALETLLNSAATPQARRAAIAELGLTPDTLIRVALVGGDTARAEAVVADCLASEAALAVSRAATRTVLLLRPQPLPDALATPTGEVRAAFSAAFPASEGAAALANASDAFRFTAATPSDQIARPPAAGGWRDGSTLHSVAALCRIPLPEIAKLPGVQVLERLRLAHGDRVLRVLEAFATTASVRSAGSALFMHRNTVAHWVRRAEDALGYSLSQPYARAVLFITLCLHHLLYLAPEASD